MSVISLSAFGKKKTESMNYVRKTDEWNKGNYVDISSNNMRFFNVMIPHEMESGADPENIEPRGATV